MAQIILAILLASATAAIFGDRRASRCTSHGLFVPCFWAYRMTASAPTTSSCRRYRSPCLVIPPSFSLPPLEFCRGTRPSGQLDLEGSYNETREGYFVANAVPTTGVPEPITLSLFGAGLFGMAFIYRRRAVERAL